MPDDSDRRRIIDRANRMVRQSATLRKLADELLQESDDLRTTAKKIERRRGARKKR